MYSIEDLFDIRSNVGARLNEYILINGITKTSLCKKSDVSRPTLDKVLNGTIGNKVNYERHICKILECLNITPDILLGKTSIKRNKLRALRKIQHTKIEDLAEYSGIRVDRLRDIEAGEEPTLAELRDLAALLNTSTSFLKGENVFDAQVSVLNHFFENDDEEFGADSGFWGHVGILPVGSDAFCWFPITGKSRSDIYSGMQTLERLVIPCMNNKLLFLNMKNIKQIILLDEACDAPEYANWEPDVDCGEIPPVVYEALDDYFYSGTNMDSDDSMSPKFRKLMEELSEREQWDEDSIHEMKSIVQHYCDGKKLVSSCELDDSSSLISQIETIYCFDEDEYAENWVTYATAACEEVLLNLEQISMLELPLTKVEEAIREVWMKEGMVD